MVKRLMAITIVVALVLAQSSIAGAYNPNDIVQAGPYTAYATPSGTPTATLSVAVKTIGGGSATELTWSGVNLGDGWKRSNQYLEVAYDANQIGWGVQVYTDNMSGSASPQFAGDPTKYLTQQPAGLIGTDAQNNPGLITCPMAILVTDSALTAAQIQTPNEVEFGTPGQDDYVIYFDTGYDEDTQKTGVEKVWFWLKDQKGTKWNDVNDDGDVDTPTNAGGYGVDPNYELVSDFSDGEDYATMVNTFGTSAGWVDKNSGSMFRDSESASPINVYVAAKFTKARELRTYKTNTVTLELYHE